MTRQRRKWKFEGKSGEKLWTTGLWKSAGKGGVKQEYSQKVNYTTYVETQQVWKGNAKGLEMKSEGFRNGTMKSIHSRHEIRRIRTGDCIQRLVNKIHQDMNSLEMKRESQRVQVCEHNLSPVLLFSLKVCFMRMWSSPVLIPNYVLGKDWFCSSKKTSSGFGT